MTTLTYSPYLMDHTKYQSGKECISLDSPNGTLIQTLYLPNDAILNELNLTLNQWYQLIYSTDRNYHRPPLTRQWWDRNSHLREGITINFDIPGTFTEEAVDLNVSVIIAEKFQLLGAPDEDFEMENPDSPHNKKFSYKSVVNIFEKLNGCKETMVNTLIDTIQYDFDEKIEEMVKEIICNDDLNEYVKADQKEALLKEKAKEKAKEKQEEHKKEDIRLKLVAAEAEVRKFTAQMEGFL